MAGRSLILIGLIGVLFGFRCYADAWDFRLGLADFPRQNTMLGLEVTRILSLSESAELGIGGVVRTDFTQTVGPGILSRFQYWLTQNFALGVLGEFGYLYHQNFSNPDSYSYFFAGPVFSIQIKPVFIQWDPGEIFYLGTSQLIPLRLAFGLFF